MRKTFLEPELEVIKFGTEDIITTSGDIPGIVEPPTLGEGEDEDKWD